MANKDRYNIEQLKEAFTKSGGFISLACKMLDCTRKTLYNYLKKYPELQEHLDDIREGYLDMAESGLISHIKEKDKQCLFFYLKTQGKNRGYVERQEFTGKDGEPIVWKETKTYDKDEESH